MKRVLKVVAICFLCVIGAFGLAIGGMYLFGGFEEKIVYADNLYFSKAEVVSAERFYFQVNTTTKDVTRKTVKLTSSLGGERIIDFPEEVVIGKTYTIIPKKKASGENVGGNVILYAQYESTDANLSAKAQCNILIDVPVDNVEIKMQNLTIKPKQVVSICQAGNDVDTALKVTPSNSLVPYYLDGVPTVAEVVDKTIFLELVDTMGNPLSTEIAKFKLNNVAQDTNIVKIGYELKGQDVVFKDSLHIESGMTQTDLSLRAYIYSTYKEQTANAVFNEEGKITSITLNKADTLNKQLNFAIGSYEITNMTINTSNKNVYLFEDTKIYLNNPNATGNDINLNVTLESDSEGVEISKYYLLDNVYISIDNPTYRTLSKSNDETLATANGLSAKFEGVSTEKEEWYWVLNINNFFAYYDYENSSKAFLVTIKYVDDQHTYTRNFNIIPKIYEVDNISVEYDEAEATSFNVKSGEKISLSTDNININTSLPVGKNPTFTELAYYISYDKNYSGGTTVSTLPLEKGNYKAVFNFSLAESSAISLFSLSSAWGTLNKAVFTQSSKVYTIEYEGGMPKPASPVIFDANANIMAEIFVDVTSTIPTQDVFYITTGDTFVVTETMVKFYESISVDTYNTVPYLSINSVRYYVDYVHYLDEKTNIRYLRINDQNQLDDLYKVQGIGSFYLTAQLVYHDAATQKTYWLGKSCDAKVEVYEELSTLSAYKYTSAEDYNDFFGTDIIYNEDDDNTYYIFLTSQEMDSLNNYVSYKQVNISFEQDYGIDVSAYNGIRNINSSAITLGNNWIPVEVSGKIVGYIISYTINPINTIKINNVAVQNTFKVVVSINVNGTYVYAKFNISEDDESLNTNYLSFDITDNTITSAVIEYASPGGANDGSTEAKALELKAALGANGVTWTGISFEDNLKYYFKYKDTDSSGTIESMAYYLTVVDDSQIALSNLYNFEFKFDETAKIGKGGLTLYNFPVYLNEEGKNQGILLRLQVRSEGTWNFNSHYKWEPSAQTFVLTQNENLVDYIYFRVYGLDINIEAVGQDVQGFKDNQVKLIDNTNGIFKFVVKAGSSDGNGNTIAVTDYSKLFKTNLLTVSQNNALPEADRQDVVVSDDYLNLVVNKDFIDDKDTTIMFFVGSSTNRIRIKVGRVGEEDVFATTYVQTVTGAYEVEVNKNFEAPTTSNNFVTVEYKNEDDDTPISELVNISLSVVSHTLSSSYGIVSPITINGDNTLTFKTVPVGYTAVIGLTVAKKNVPTDFIYSEYTITVLPTLNENDLVIGSLHNAVGPEDSTYHFITAGEDNAVTLNSGSIVYAGKLLENKAKISKVSVTYANVNANETLDVNLHMNMTNSNGNLTIWSDDLNYDKDVKLTFVFEFNDGGKFIYEKVIKVKSNLTLNLIKTHYSVDETINLTDTSKYTFTKNAQPAELDLSTFEYDNLSASYNKNTFTYSSTYFDDVSSIQSYNDFSLKVKNPNYTVQTTAIAFKFVTDKGYALQFVLNITISSTLSENELTVGLLHISTGDGDSNYYYLNAGEVNAISTTNGKISFSGKLAEANEKIKQINVSIEDDAAYALTADEHMVATISGKNVSIYSKDIAEDKDVNITFTFVFTDDTTFVITKKVKVVANVTLTLKNAQIKSVDTINLIDSNNYVLTINGTEQTLNMLDFNFDSETTNYNKNNFVVDSAMFEREGTEANTYTLKVKSDAGNAGEEKESTITFVYVTSYGYNLTFDLTYTIAFE